MIIFAFLTGLVAFIGTGIEIASSKTPLRVLQYYTIQTNLLVGISAFLWILMPNPFTANVIQAAALWIAVTGIFFHLLLSKLYQPLGIKALSNLLTHTLTPLCSVVLSLLIPLGPTQHLLDLPQVALWISYPLLYTSFWLIYGHFVDYYPYWFLRPRGKYPDGMGSYKRVSGFIVVSCMFFVLLGLSFNLVKLLI